MAIVPHMLTMNGPTRRTLESGYICPLTDEEFNDYSRMIVHTPQFHDLLSAAQECEDPMLRDYTVTAGRYLEAKGRMQEVDTMWYRDVVLAHRRNRNEAGRIIIVPGEPAGMLTRAWRAFWKMTRWPL